MSVLRRFLSQYILLSVPYHTPIQHLSQITSKVNPAKPSELSEAAASKEGEEEDLGALIYRESQLRKREAADAAADDAVKKSERNSSASTHIVSTKQSW